MGGGTGDFWINWVQGCPLALVLLLFINKWVFNCYGVHKVGGFVHLRINKCRSNLIFANFRKGVSCLLPKKQQFLERVIDN